MRNNRTNEQQPSGFPPVPEEAPAPSEAVWEGIQRSLKRKDFWRVKGKVLLMAAIACITTVTLLQLSGPATEIRPDPQPVTGSALPEPVQTATFSMTESRFPYTLTISSLKAFFVLRTASLNVMSTLFPLSSRNFPILPIPISGLS